MDGQRMLRVLVIGDASHGDFADASAELRRTARAWFVPDGDHAEAWLQANRPVDWIVLVQARPGELPREIVDQVRPHAGDARFISLLGSWCEGELRTGRPWPDVPRRYWHAFPSWWGTGVTGFASDSDQADRTGKASDTPPGIVVVSTVDLETADALLDAVASEGYSATWWPRYREMPRLCGAAAGVWVGGQLGGPEALQLDRFCQRMRSERAPVVALLDFPRRDRVEIAKRIGVTEVLGKPWLIADLVQTLRRLTGIRGEITDSRSLALRSA